VRGPTGYAREDARHPRQLGPACTNLPHRTERFPGGYLHPPQKLRLLRRTGHPHIHAVAAEGVFGESGEFVALPAMQKHRAEESWQERVFALLLDTHTIDEVTAGSMRAWEHSGFSVDTSVRIQANDLAGMSRLVGYITRSPHDPPRHQSSARRPAPEAYCRR
jgi:hypothetical protein